MWFFTPFGFFSVVQKRGESLLTIRSRARSDLLRLQRHYLPQLGEPLAHEGTDYPWRARCRHEDLSQAMARIVRQIDYANFKDEVALSNGKDRAKRYGKVWQALYGMEDDLPEPVREGFEGLPWSVNAPAGKKRAFGGVVVDPQGRLLLREVAGHFDGYVWTYAKGRPDAGESPRQAALREVREEMGIDARILVPLPGTFAGTTTQTQFFLMVVDPRGVDLEFRSRETARLCWALPEEAQRLIAQTTNALGRERDLRILEEALRFLPSPMPFQRPIARREDWEFRPMPAARKRVDFERSFNPAQMAQLVRGFLSQVMEQKWCAYLEDGVVRIHRSWTGYEVFRLHLAPHKKLKGHWFVEKTELNRHPAQVTLDEREALQGLSMLLDSYLLNYGEEPAVDGFVLGLNLAMQPNYLGSPRVVQGLVRDFLSGLLGAVQEGSWEAQWPALVAPVVAAMTDDPAYTRMPWHSREQLGECLIETMGLPPDPQARVGLGELVARSLEKVRDALLEFLSAFDGIDAGDEGLAPPWAGKVEEVGQFMVAVFLGTHGLSHRGKGLADVVREPGAG